MKFLPLVWAGLWRTPLRTALTFLSIATTFLLFGTLYGVNAGLDQAIGRISATQLHITPRNLDRGLPIHYRQEIDRIPGVASTMVSQAMSAYYRDPHNLFAIAAVGGRVDLGLFGDIADANRLVAKLQATRTGAIVGRGTATKNGFKVGDRVSLNTGAGLNKDGTDFMVFDIVGIYDVPTSPGGGRWFLLNFDYLQEVRGLKATTDLYANAADPSRDAEVALAIDNHFDSGEAATYTAPEREYRRSTYNRAVDVKLVVTAIVSASMFALLMLSTSTLMHSVRQRAPELAIMKSLGFTDAKVILFVTGEAFLLFTSAAVLGVSVATLLYPLASRAIDAPVTSMPLQVPIVAVLIAMLAAVVSSLLPAVRIRRVEVATVLARAY